MIHDPIVEEVHRWRQEILARYDGDIEKWFQHLKAREAEHPERMVDREYLLELRRAEGKQPPAETPSEPDHASG